MVRNEETVPERRRKGSGPGGRSNQGEMSQIDPDGGGPGAFPHDDIKGKVFHGGIEYFLHVPIQPVNFIDEKDVMILESSQDSCQFSRTADGGPTGLLELGSQLIGNDFCHGRFPKARRSVKEDVIQGFFAGFGRSDIDFQIFFERFLADVVIQPLGA